MEKEYWLNEKQAIFIAMIAGTEPDAKNNEPRAFARGNAIRREIVEVIYALRHGDKVPPMPVLISISADIGDLQSKLAQASSSVSDFAQKTGDASTKADESSSHFSFFGEVNSGLLLVGCKRMLHRTCAEIATSGQAGEDAVMKKTSCSYGLG
jgi:hypothetical protein